jgi:YesN/AraC family two-component response regulator
MFGNKRILIVDDEEFSLSALEVVLKCAKINVKDRVDLAMSGQDALELVKLSESNGMRYCLILTDISMP